MRSSSNIRVKCFSTSIKIDLYFCPFSALYPRPLPLPTVVTLVDIQEVFYPEFFTDSDRYNRERHFPTSTRMADRTITISEFSPQTLVQHHKLAAGRVVVSYLSADERFSRSATIALLPSSPLPDSFVFYPANFWKHKNHDCLLRALQLLRDQRGLTIHAVCTGFEQPNGYPAICPGFRYGVRAQVHLLGHVEVWEIAHLYRRARMLVFPSLFEGFGIPLVEAMTVGCPIVAAADTSIPEIVGDAAERSDSASPERFAEAIERVWNDEQTKNGAGCERHHPSSCVLPGAHGPDASVRVRASAAGGPAPPVSLESWGTRTLSAQHSRLLAP